MMKQVEHREFLDKNKIEIKSLLTPIQDKTKVFDTMHDLLENITPCGKGSLIKQLEKLDGEILKDIYDVYGDKISNNVLTEDPKEKKGSPKKIISKAKVNSDEFVIDQLVELGQTENIGRSTFLDLGLKKNLEWNTVIGKYLIKRISVFKYRYDILLKA